MDLDKLPINAFDCVVLATLVVGIMRGRKHGMSEELIGLVTWMAVVIVCAMVYEPAGQWFAQSSPFSLLASFLMVYIAGALLILSIWLFYPPVYYIMLWSSRYRYPVNWTLLFTAGVALNHVYSKWFARQAVARGAAQ